jgi:hypothetical protein
MDIVGNNEERAILMAREIGFKGEINSWFEAAMAIARAFNGVENAKELFHSMVWSTCSVD